MTFTIISESWFVPSDILMIVCLISAIILGSLFLFIIIFDKTCHTIPMMLVANSCLSQIMFAGDILLMMVITLQNDLKQIAYQDPLCVVRGYISYASFAVMYYSFLLQAGYRYITVVYPTRLFCQSIRFQILIICITWIFGYIYPLAFLFTGDITYNVNNQVCQIPLRFSFPVIVMIVYAFIIPVTMIQLIYLKLVRYVKEISKRVIPTNNLSRARKELKMVRRIVIIITILVTLGLPYTFFILISFFTDPPKYHFRISAVFINSSLVFVMIALFQFTDPLKSSILKRLNLRANSVVPVMAFVNETKYRH